MADFVPCSFASVSANAEFSLANKRSVRLGVSLKKAIGLAKPLWTRSTYKIRRKTWVLSGLLALFAVGSTALHVIISFQEKALNSALSQKDEQLFYRTIKLYFAVILIACPFFAYFYFLQDMLALHWRTWFTESLLGDYFAHRAYYSIHQGFSYDDVASKNQREDEIDNPDQRISEDVRTFTSECVRFLLLSIQQIFQILGFAGILYSISPLLVLFLIFYAIFGTYLTISFFGTKLVPLNAQKLKSEGDFRYSLVRLSEHAESIAFHRGEENELLFMKFRYQRVMNAMTDLILWQRHLSSFKNFYHFLTYLIPPLILAPKYLAGEIEFGTIAQTAMAFRMVLNSLTVIVQQFSDLSRFSAGIDRLYQIVSYLEQHRIWREIPENHPKVLAQNQLIRKFDQHDLVGVVDIRNLTITTPTGRDLASLGLASSDSASKSRGHDHGQILIKNLDLTLKPGDRILIAGNSGCGKSSLLRSLAGLWSFGNGIIAYKGSCRKWETTSVMFLPQKPYLIIGSLREQLCYPYSQGNLHDLATDRELNAILVKLNLEGLVERVGGLDVSQSWEDVLSIGEQQRIVFARVLVHKPEILFLDESTSALDSTNEKNIYELLSKDSSRIYVSVGHRDSLLQHHSEVLHVEEGKWHLKTVNEYRRILRKNLLN